MRMKQRKCADEVVDCSHLGRVALQELQSRWNVGEEIAHLDRHAWQQRPRSLLDQLSRPHWSCSSCTREFALPYPRNAGECLAPKPEADARDQVRQLGPLAGRMPHEGKGQ